MKIKQKISPIAAVIDQALLSFLNFSISIFFVWGASKDQYGYYLLLITPLLLVQSVQSALINSPLATYLPASLSEKKERIVSTAQLMHGWLAAVCTLLAVFALLLIGAFSLVSVSGFLVVSFCLAIIGTIAREGQRSICYVMGKGVGALWKDFQYGVILLLGLVFAFYKNIISAEFVLLAIGSSAIFVVLIGYSNSEKWVFDRSVVRDFWLCGRWALPSVFATWLSLNSYPYFAKHFIGVSAVADIGASRLLLMPVGLLITAWSNWFRPRISGWYARGQIDEIVSLTRKCFFWVGFTFIFFLLFVWLGYGFFELIVGVEYRGLKPVVIAWSVFFFLSFLRNVGMASLMVNSEGYKILHHLTWVGFFISIFSLFVFSSRGSVWVVGVLSLVEFFQLVVVLVNARIFWEKGRVNNI